MSSQQTAAAGFPTDSGYPARIVSPDMETALAQFSSPQLLAEGVVNIIALDAIVERFGKRWNTRSEHVHAHVQSNLERAIGELGYFLRVSDTDVLICLPQMGRHAAQAACLRYLREILSYFLGESAVSDLRVHEVISISPDGIKAKALDPREIAAAGAQRSAPSLRPVEDQSPSHRGVYEWEPFVSAGGRKIQVSCQLEPVHELRGFSCIGLRVLPTAVFLDRREELSAEKQAALPLRDLVRIDLATISAGLAGLRADSGIGREPSVILPITAASLS